MSHMGVILSVSEGSDIVFEGVHPRSFGQKAALRMTFTGVILSTAKDLFLPFKGQDRILRRLRLLRMTKWYCRPERSEGPVFLPF